MPLVGPELSSKTSPFSSVETGPSFSVEHPWWIRLATSGGDERMFGVAGWFSGRMLSTLPGVDRVEKGLVPCMVGIGEKRTLLGSILPCSCDGASVPSSSVLDLGCGPIKHRGVAGLSMISSLLGGFTTELSAPGSC